MRLPIVVLCVAIISVGISPAFCQQDQSPFKHSAETYRSSVYPGVFNLNTWPFHRSLNGYLVAWQHESSPSQPAVTLLDRDGNLVREAVVWMPEAVRVTITDVTVTRSGRLIVSGGAASGNGAIANFLLFSEPNGKIGILRTNPFAPNYVCAIGEDTVWTYGWDRDGEQTKHYSMLREYSSEAGLVSSLLNRSSMPDDYMIRGSRLGNVALTCNSTKVDLFVADTGELIEHNVIETNDSIIRWRFPKTDRQTQISGSTLTEKGDFFVSISGNLESGKPVHGIFSLEPVSGNNRAWKPVQNTFSEKNAEHRSLELLGSDGNDLVYLSDSFKHKVEWAHVK